jgi:hypothetical protein
VSVTNISQAIAGNVIVLSATSDLGGTVYFFWYLNGAFIGMTTGSSQTIALGPGDQGRIDALDSNDPDFDFVANAPAGYPARRTLVFVRSLDADVDRYKIEQQQNGGSWALLGYVPQDDSKWNYEVLSPRLADLTTYAWRVTPIDIAGNTGTPATIAAEYIVRTPDAPDFSASFNPATSKVTFASA